jgi:hypothetical protein
MHKLIFAILIALACLAAAWTASIAPGFAQRQDCDSTVKDCH